MEAVPQTPEMVTAERSVMQGRKHTDSLGGSWRNSAKSAAWPPCCVDREVTAGRPGDRGAAGWFGG